MTNYDDMKFAVETISGGKNTVLLDDAGMPSVVVPFPKLKYSDVFAGGTQTALPAFIVDGQEKPVIYVSKYQNIIVNERAYSLPMKDPASSLKFERALQVCRNKGEGWHLTTNALWAAIALWCKKNGTLPRGNNNYGQDILSPHEKGIPSMALDGSGRVQRTATGSGPVSWYHNHNDSGISDLNGNVWEWVSGLRLVDGEIQTIPYGDAMKSGCRMDAGSTEWQAILPDGSFAEPGTEGTLKYDYAASKVTLATTLTTQADTGRNTSFEALALASDVTVPMLLKGIGLYPADASGYEGDNIWINNTGERFPIRGGPWNHSASVGVFAVGFHNVRTYVNSILGFRSAFYE